MNVTQDSGLIEAKTRLTNAQADMKEMQLSILRGEYIKAEDVVSQWNEQAGRVRQKLLVLPVKLGGILGGQELSSSEIEALCQKLVNEALEELAGEYEAKA